MAESIPLLQRDIDIPLVTFTFAKDNPEGRRPQAIAHRGFKARNPENSMSAFRDAVEVGAHAIETDLRLTKDGVVILSHDPSLKRCFGKDWNVADSTWDEIKSLCTLQPPYQPVARLEELLEYLVTPGLEDIWLLLDVKVLLPSLWQALTGDHATLKEFDDYADSLYKNIALTLAKVRPTRPWHERVVIGCWAAKYLPLCIRYFPGYSITHIGFSTDYAREFLKVPHVGLNMFLMLIIGPRGQALLQDVKKKRSDRSIFLWTVNGEAWMKWSIRQQVDGVITDDPKKYLEICKIYDESEKPSPAWPSWKAILYWHLRNLAFGLSFRYKHGFWVNMDSIARSLGR